MPDSRSSHWAGDSRQHPAGVAPRLRSRSAGRRHDDHARRDEGRRRNESRRDDRRDDRRSSHPRAEEGRGGWNRGRRSRSRPEVDRGSAHSRRHQDGARQSQSSNSHIDRDRRQGDIDSSRFEGHYKRRLDEERESAAARGEDFYKRRLHEERKSGGRNDGSSGVKPEMLRPTPPDHAPPRRENADANMERHQTRNRSRTRNAGRSNETPLDTVHVPQVMLARIIGRQESTINEIEKKSGARIEVNEDSKGVIKIAGSRSSMAQANEKIIELVEELCKEAADPSNGEDWAEETVQIAESQVGHIIGEAGQSVRALQEESGAKIDVDAKGRVLIRGATDSVVRAIDMVAELMDKAPGVETTVEEPVEDAVEETLEVPENLIGRVIGRGGETIKKLEADSGARIKVNSKGGSPTIKVQGIGDAVTCAIDLIKAILAKFEDNSVAVEEETVEETIDVPPEMFGLIIGRGGQTIKKLQDDSSAKVAVDKTSNAVHLSGPSDCVAHARDLIVELLGEGAARDDKTEESIDIPPEMLGRIFGHGGKDVKRLQDESGARIKVKVDLNVIQLSGTTECVARANELIVDWIAAAAEGVEEIMNVPSELMGKIIGKGGQTVNTLQDDSGARISVDKDDNTKVHLRGSSECVDRARQLIEELLAGGSYVWFGEEDWTEETVGVPPQMLGKMFGRGGESVKKLKEASGAEITWSDEQSGVHISGTSKCVAQAKDMVLELVAEGEPDSKMIEAGWQSPFWAKIEMRRKAAQVLVKAKQDKVGKIPAWNPANKKEDKLDAGRSEREVAAAKRAAQMKEYFAGNFQAMSQAAIRKERQKAAVEGKPAPISVSAARNQRQIAAQAVAALPKAGKPLPKSAAKAEAKPAAKSAVQKILPAAKSAVQKVLPKPLESMQKPESQSWRPPLEAPVPKGIEKLQPWRPPTTTTAVAPGGASMRSAPPKPSQAPNWRMLESDSEDDRPPGDL